MSVIHQLHYLKHPRILSSPQTLEDARCRLRSNAFKKTSLACMFFLRHFRSRGNTLEKCFFQISSYSCAHARIIYQRQLGIPLKQEANWVSFKLLCTNAFVFFHRNASYLSACLLHRYFTQVRFHKWSTLSLTCFLTLR